MPDRSNHSCQRLGCARESLQLDFHLSNRIVPRGQLEQLQLFI
jgi:hypothetical protein